MISDPRILRASAAIHDLLVCAAAFTAAHVIAFGPERYWFVPGIAEKTIAFEVVSMGSLYLMRLNRGLWKYASISDLVAIAKAATLAVMVFTVGNFLVERAEYISRIAMILTWVFMIFGLGAGRVVYRFAKESVFLPNRRDAAGSAATYLLYPFSDTTDAYIRAVRRLAPDGVSLAGIIDSRPKYARSQLHGLRVLGRPGDIDRIVARRKLRGLSITELVVTDPTISGSEMTTLLEYCNSAGIGISRLPDMFELAKAGRSAVLAPNPVRLEDLLGRAEIKVDFAAIAAFVKGRTVLVTGAGGTIGAELCRQIAGFNPSRIVMLELSEQNLYEIKTEFLQDFPEVRFEAYICDVRDRHRVEKLMNAVKPDVVFHAAALKHVPIVENNPLEAIKTNFIGTSIVASAAHSSGAKAFILISTDKAVNPTSVMGATKRAAELYCQALDLALDDCCFRIVRFGNVLGSSGSVVPLFKKQIERGGPVTVRHPDVSRYFMTIPEAVSLILGAASHGLSNGHARGSILILDMGEPIRIVDLARRLIQLAGFIPEKDIAIEYTGLRPGEKLEEELLSVTESSNLQRYTGFVAAHSRSVEKAAIENWIDEIAKACDEENRLAALEILGTIVPSYRPWEAIPGCETAELPEGSTPPGRHDQRTDAFTGDSS